MAKLTLTDIANTSSSSAASTINANMAAIETAMEKTLSRDGTSPNTMGSNLDMNSYRIVNVADPQNAADAANKDYVDNSAAFVQANLAAAAAQAAQAEAEAAAAAAEAAAAAAINREGGENVFYHTDYVDGSQLGYIAAGDTASQNETLVTTGIRALMDAAMNWVEAGGATDRTAYIVAKGKFAINGEMFSETFAEKLWNLSSPTHARFVFVFWGAVFQAKNWPSHKAVRSSGFYGEQNILAPVPQVMFRWEQKVKKGFGPHILGGVLAGERQVTDPIGLKMRNVNLGLQVGFEVRNFLNVGRWIDDANNSDFFGTVVSRCGYQPTQAGGNGFVSSTVRVSCTGAAGQTSVVATENIFDATDHVGKWFMIKGAGEGGTEFAALIQSVSSPTQAVLNRQVTTDVTNAQCSFAMLEGSISADSAVLTLATNVTDDLVGRYVMVYGAGSKLHSGTDNGEGILVTRVIQKIGKVLTLETQARFTVANAPICIAPSTFMGKCDDQVQSDGVTPEGGHNNDLQFFGERIEYSFETIWGGALSTVEQYVLAVQFYGRKTHGTNATYNNFGGNGANRWFDNCKFYSSNNEQIEFGDWHPTKGKICVTGDRNLIYFSAVNIGGLEAMDHGATFYIDPLTNNRGDCRVIVSGFSNTPETRRGLSNQAFVRTGTYGQAAMVAAGGPFVSRGSDGYPEMPTQHMGNVDLWSDTPTITLRDVNGNVRHRLSANGGRLSIQYDHNGDGIYDQGGFGWSASNGLEVDLNNGDGFESCFEKGTFTPTLKIGGVDIASSGGSYSSRSGRYMRVLDRVFVAIKVTLTAKGSGTGLVELGVPTSLRPSQGNEHIGIGFYTGFASISQAPFAATIAGQDSIRLRMRGAGGTGYVDLTEANITNTSRIEVSGWYEI